MTPERWQQIDKLCQSALELEENRRAAFLEEACAGDEELRREVESMLKFEKPGDRFIEQQALEVAAKMIAHDKPESLIGQQLGSYQIVSLLGAGGMGVVYEARDTRLNRSVAIKVLPSDRVSDPERKRRFIQEARAASALNHSNIITIHDIGSENGTDFIVMEYVTGKTLDQRIPRKGMHLNEALKLAIQIADALAKAHSAGIIHRDLKPTNVMVTEDGVVKVLDFGLAKLTEVAESDERTTLTLRPQTEEGAIVGTVSYMSPEQAEGKKVDARSDIFSFGAVLYEMVTGQKAFQGESRMSTMAAILNKNPKPLIEINPAVLRDLDRIINHCLRKDPGRRFQHTDDLRVELEELKEESDSGKLAGTPTGLQSARRTWLWAGAALVVVAMAYVTWFIRGGPRKPQAALEVLPLTSFAGFEASPSFSPDSNQVVFSWDGEKQDNIDIYVKLVGSPTPQRLTTDPAEDVSPAFSPDGRSIGFVRVSKERATFIVIPSIGGPERVVAEVAAPDASLPPGHLFAWLPDGKWVVIDGLALLSTESGEPRSLTFPPTRSLPDHSPAVSLDGSAIAFSRSTGVSASDIYLLDLDEDLKPKGEPRRLTFLKRNSYSPAWTPNGREITFASGVFFSPDLWRISTSGSGEPEQLPFTGGEASWPAISRSGNRLAYVRWVSDPNIWRLSLSVSGAAAGPPVPLINSTRIEYSPQYSPNGKRIAFESNRSGVWGIWISDAEGANAVELFSRAGAHCGSPRWSPDGRRVAFDSTAEGNVDIYVIRSGGGKAIRLTTDSADDRIPSWSRDGNWIYFASERSGRYEIWKAPAGGGEAIQVTRNRGWVAFESPDGKFVYYTKEAASSALWKMPVSGGEESQVLPSVFRSAFSVVKDGIYFIPEPGADGKYSIQFLRFAIGKVKTVVPIPVQLSYILNVSPDGRSLLYTQLDETGSDLMLVENFR
jgi:eukaryotic-like serine/threonine-protein kinase